MGVPLLVYPAANAAVTIQIAETDVNPVVAGSDQFGWVSGSPAGLVAGATAVAIFDLGPLWFMYSIVGLCITATGASGLQYIMASSNDTPAFSVQRRAKDLSSVSLGMLYTNATAGGPINFFIRPMGRYIAINLNNADTVNSQGPAAKITIAAYPS